MVWKWEIIMHTVQDVSSRHGRSNIEGTVETFQFNLKTAKSWASSYTYLTLRIIFNWGFNASWWVKGTHSRKVYTYEEVCSNKYIQIRRPPRRPRLDPLQPRRQPRPATTRLRRKKQKRSWNTFINAIHFFWPIVGSKYLCFLYLSCVVSSQFAY